MGHDHSSPGIESQSHRSRSIRKCGCYTIVYCGVLWVLTDGRYSRFLLSRHQLRASAARRAASGVQRVWAWYGGRSDLDPGSMTICFPVRRSCKRKLTSIFGLAVDRTPATRNPRYANARLIEYFTTADIIVCKERTCVVSVNLLLHAFE